VTETLLQVRCLKKYFQTSGGMFRKSQGFVHAVDCVDLYVGKGETLGLVGESGCGKTTLGRTILRLIEPTSGEILFENRDILKMKKGEMRKLRSQIQMVFQDPQSSLDPRKTVKAIISEPFVVNGTVKGGELKKRVVELLTMVGLNPEHLYRFPHEFSGGQRQRIGIARAIALRPKFLILDEPTSSLDVSVQAQILNLLKDLQKEMGLSYLFISHDLSVVEHMSTRIAVMYLGEIVETAKKEDLFKQQLHPYTQALFSAIPIPDPHVKTGKIVLSGDVPNPANPPPGCRFHPRCKYARRLCREEKPILVGVGNEHSLACHMYTESWKNSSQ
jgi:oligopeptide/dipeptide ABC transporter ATP-binding protein